MTQGQRAMKSDSVGPWAAYSQVILGWIVFGPDLRYR